MCIRDRYGYGFVLSDENQYFYAVNSGQAQSADGAVRIKLYDDQRIMEIDYKAEGAEAVSYTHLVHHSD